MASLTPHQERALDYRNHISLTANAGSGKTFVLSKRFVKIITEENIPLRNIAAITFTDKAASELYKKIAVLIEDSILTSGNPNEIKKLESLRRQLVSANISTIHSFCINILREHPVEAGLDANFSAIDEKTADELVELSVEEMIRKAMGNPTEENDLKYLIRYFSSKSLFTGEIISLIRHRKNVLNVSERIYSRPEDEIAGRFYSSFMENAEKIFMPGYPNFISAMRYINAKVIAARKDNAKGIEVEALLSRHENIAGTENKIKFIRSLGNQILTTKETINSREYLNKKLRDDLAKEIDTVENFFAEFSFINLPENHTEIELEMAHFGKLVIKFFLNALEIYSGKKKESGYLDYEDILLYTKDILAREPVQKYLSEKFRYIMIDEYQDTNEIQYNIFLPILDYLRKGNLFVVGDEKQSIYMFRDAELEVFNLTKKDIVASAGNEYLISLPDSFRMAPAICLFANELFKNLFREPELFYNEVEHKDIICARQDEIPGGVEILIFPKPGNAADENTEEDIPGSSGEADLVAGRILDLVNSGADSGRIEWGDIAVLCRKRKYFPELERAFVNFNIPFSILGGKGFFQKQAVYDVYNYFSFLADEKNDTALAGILRSPFFSRSDAEIYEISLRPGNIFWNKLINYSTDEPAFKKITGVLRENLALANNFNVPSLLRKILSESNFLTVLASKKNGDQEIANIEKLIKVTIDFFSQGFKTLYDYAAFLRDSIEGFEDEAQAAVADESNSVKIMTLHQAKGLEFPAIVLYKCDEVMKKDSIKSKKISVDKNFGLLTKVPLRENYSAEYSEAPVIGIADLIQYKKSLAEFKRLLYVGITRAKNYLFISGSANKDNQFGANSFLGLVQKGLNIDFSSDNFLPKSKLKFLKCEGNSYTSVEREITVPIKIITEVKANPAAELKQGENISEKIFKTDCINDEQKGEIISATKLSVFEQCPIKYYLTYDLGYQPLFDRYKTWMKDKYEDNKDKILSIKDGETQLEEGDYTDENLRKFSDVRGRIIHSLLQNEVGYDDIDNFVSVELENEFSTFERDRREIIQLSAEIISDVKKFYASNTYRYLHGFKKYFNEYEVYSAEKDYFLFGRIDKLIIDGSTAVIVDYKSDDVPLDRIKEKAGGYLIQLRFYSYLAVKLFPDISKFRLMLVFIRQPANPVTEDIDLNDVKSLGGKIENMVKVVREKKYWKNINHCKNCYYSTKWNRCIIEK